MMASSILSKLAKDFCLISLLEEDDDEESFVKSKIGLKTYCVGVGVGVGVGERDAMSAVGVWSS